MIDGAAHSHVYDVVGIGIGPFNLGLAALTEPLDDVDAIFLDAADGFRWHPGMMIDGASLQVPFLADLVSMADPTSRFSFVNHLKQTGRLYPFYIREDFHPLRAEFDTYYRWVADQLDTLLWRRNVTEVERGDDGLFLVRAALGDTERIEEYRTRHVVLGIGTAPHIPEALRTVGGPIVHSSGYLSHRDRLRDASSVTIIGSGQSAAEIYRDLLDGCDDGHRLDWVTRSPRFFPMEYTKLTLELTSPEYLDHFHALPMELRDRLGREQRSLYKGISAELINRIYDTLYRKSLGGTVPTTLLSETALESAEWDAEKGEFSLHLHHKQLATRDTRRTAAVVLATGYRPADPAFLAPLGELIERDERGRLLVARDYTIDHAADNDSAISNDASSNGARQCLTHTGRIFVQNAEEHTHGLTAPDLGFGAWRNSVIIKRVTGREVYAIERRISFQQFGLPHQVNDAGAAAEGAQ